VIAAGIFACAAIRAWIDIKADAWRE